MKTPLQILTVLMFAVISQPSAQSMPPGLTHEAHQEQMKKAAGLKGNGLASMGFDQEAAVHHFRLRADGGAIEVEVVRSADNATRATIRAHLREIAVDFAEGRFEKPFRTHGEMPLGTPELVRLRHAITYQFEEMPAGGRVRITTANSEAVAAVHAFLKYQIHEHATADSHVIRN